MFGKILTVLLVASYSTAQTAVDIPIDIDFGDLFGNGGGSSIFDDLLGNITGAGGNMPDLSKIFNGAGDNAFDLTQFSNLLPAGLKGATGFDDILKGLSGGSGSFGDISALIGSECSTECTTLATSCFQSAGTNATKLNECANRSSLCASGCLKDLGGLGDLGDLGTITSNLGGTVVACSTSCFDKTKTCVSGAGSDITATQTCATEAAACAQSCFGQLPGLPAAVGTCETKCVSDSGSCITTAASDFEALKGCAVKASACAQGCLGVAMPTGGVSSCATPCMTAAKTCGENAGADVAALMTCAQTARTCGEQCAHSVIGGSGDAGGLSGCSSLCITRGAECVQTAGTDVEALTVCATTGVTCAKKCGSEIRLPDSTCIDACKTAGAKCFKEAQAGTGGATLEQCSQSATLCSGKCLTATIDKAANAAATTPTSAPAPTSSNQENGSLSAVPAVILSVVLMIAAI